MNAMQCEATMTEQPGFPFDTPACGEAPRPFVACELKVAGRSCLVPLASIRETISMVSSISPPATDNDHPSWLLGTIRHGVDRLPIVDLHRVVTGERSDLALDSSIVILDDPASVGLLVETSGDLVEITPDQLPAAVKNNWPEHDMPISVRTETGTAMLLSIAALASQLEGR